MLKATARNQYQKKLSALTQEEYDTATALIFHKFCQYQWPLVRNILSYSPMRAKREFDVLLFEDQLRSTLPGIVMCWPKINPPDKSMEAHEINNEKFYTKNKFNILEPLDGFIISPAHLDIVFVPSNGIDKRGYRIGHGMGYYDRYLSRCGPQTLKVGVSFFELFDEFEDIHAFDVPLNICITPQRVYEF